MQNVHDFETNISSNYMHKAKNKGDVYAKCT